MAKRPLLTSYPHLHHVLKRDTVANQQFNAVLNDIDQARQNGDPSAVALQQSQLQYEELLAEHQELLKFSRKAKALLRKFGEVLEPQVKLNAYSEDIAECREYVIKFTADQIRMVLSLHWDVVARRVEDIIAGTPVDKEEEE